ncbi:hypothetical protein [Pseudoalteromonas sp. R3]|uniref:hypothetical protein n=1 Tax=Pseudoalteromonas sp. R3 TaxID=1709477 RepID=UPI0006B5A26C|nr:hypothetical protein [Pseudoalteromonas sp. R3]AZZ96290.1 hypothetical protein ELR70_03605 [Pseudoalteromonas sp. R3]
MEALTIFEAPVSGALGVYRYFLLTGVVTSGYVLIQHFLYKERALKLTIFYSFCLFTFFYLVANSQQKFYKAVVRNNIVILFYPSNEVYLDINDVEKSQFRYKNYRNSREVTCRISLITNDKRYSSGEKDSGCKQTSKRINKLLEKRAAQRN